MMRALALPGRWLYRVHQFWAAVRACPSAADLVLVAQTLTPEQAALFVRLQINEQAHSLQVLRKLMVQGETDADLLAAALLHDVGKCLQPLRLWERVWVVLSKAVCAQRARAWGEAGLPSPAWRRPFVVAAQHPAWGARLAESAGCSARTVELIARHQDQLVPGSSNGLDGLLIKLQMADDKA
jgi:hypothetical protein